MANQEGEWIVHNERPIYESEWVRVGLADISQPSGDRFEHHTVWFPPPAMTVLIDDAGENVLMAWRHRFAPDLWNWELPGGIIDPGETPYDTALRELIEETGYRPRGLESLVTFEPAVGMLRNPHHVFLGRGAELVGDATEVNEGRFEWVPLSKIPNLIREGKIKNSGTLVGLLHYLALGGEN
ncbi:NUDIX hydrolase [Saccharopolyspora hattusasensis]|uniref:NUDIX hydrolase n=1 Tax=Saccharopolyspora hattusasensis TaxID=1128679 RepID=UPI003D993E71